jgi:hypothetical protein
MSNLLANITAVKAPRSHRQVWLGLSLTIAAIYGLLALQQAFGSEYVVQDDARQHIFWLRRFLDSELFPNNLIADYFQSVAPAGFTAFYGLFAKLGLDPMLLAKVLPLPLALIATVYGFAVSLQLLPLPLTAFLSSLMIQQVLWTHDDLTSATPRAFMPAIFLAFLYYLLKRSLWPCLLTIVLEGLFYPQYVFVFAGLLLLQPLRWHNGRPTLATDRKTYRFCAVALAVAVAVLLPYALASSGYGPTITAAAARGLPEFTKDGRSHFFNDQDPLAFWLYGERSGLFPHFRPGTMAIGFLLPLLLAFRRYFPLAQHLTRQMRILLEMTVVALGLFALAHAVLFKLHLPSRYTGYTLRFVLAFATAISISLMFEASLQWLRLRSRPGWMRPLVWGIAAIFAWGLLVYPSTIPDFPKTNYVVGKVPGLYEFIAQQPKDTVVAGIIKEINDVPSFTNRSIVIGREYAIPYHLGYASQFRQQTIDLVTAQSTSDRAELTQFTQSYGVDFWLVNRKLFKPKELADSWVSQYPEAVSVAQKNLAQGKPLLLRSIKRCTVFKQDSLLLLDAECAIAPPGNRPGANSSDSQSSQP